MNPEGRCPARTLQTHNAVSQIGNFRRALPRPSPVHSQNFIIVVGQIYAKRKCFSETERLLPRIDNLRVSDKNVGIVVNGKIELYFGIRANIAQINYKRLPATPNVRNPLQCRSSVLYRVANVAELAHNSAVFTLNHDGRRTIIPATVPATFRKDAFVCVKIQIDKLSGNGIADLSDKICNIVRRYLCAVVQILQSTAPVYPHQIAIMLSG